MVADEILRSAQADLRTAQVTVTLEHILRDRFGGGLVINDAPMARLVSRFCAGRPGGAYSQPQRNGGIDHDLAGLMAAANAVTAAVPAVLARARAAAAEYESRGAPGDPFADGYRRAVRDLEQFQHLAERFADPDALRKPDPRSGWHPLAQGLAEAIEEICRCSGLPTPSRMSLEGPIVQSVREMLALGGRNVTADAVRNAIKRTKSAA